MIHIKIVMCRGIFQRDALRVVLFSLCFLSLLSESTDDAAAAAISFFIFTKFSISSQTSVIVGRNLGF